MKASEWGTVALMMGALAMAGCGRETRSSVDAATFTVRRGPLEITIVETASIESREKVVVRSQATGRCTVISLVEEGRLVEEGDVLAELDSSEFEESRLQQEIVVENAEAKLINAREQLAITLSLGESEVEKAQLDLKFAKLDIIKYTKGEYPMELRQATSAITLAEEELKRAEDKLDWSNRLGDDGHVTRMELEGDQFAVKRASIELQVTRDKLALLEDYAHGQKLEKLDSDVKQATMSLDRAKRKAAANTIKAEADLRASESAHTQQKAKLEKTLAQIKACRITAPQAGMVVYATSQGGGWRRRSEPLETGQQVTERQELFHLPATDDMSATIRVQEASLPKIRVGQPVRIKVEALKGKILAAELTKVGVLPDATQAWLNPDLKVFRCEANLTESDPALRPGMSSQAEIVVDRLKDAVYVPVQSVVKVAGRPTVYVSRRGKVKPRTVEVGQDNYRMVHVTSGLEEGEEVLLVPPLQASSRESAADRSDPVRGSAKGRRAERAAHD